MLTVNLHHLEEHEIHLEGELSVKELELEVSRSKGRSARWLSQQLPALLPTGGNLTGNQRTGFDVHNLEATEFRLALLGANCGLSEI